LCLIVLFSFLLCANPECEQEAQPVALEIIKKELFDAKIGNDWKIEEYDFGSLLTGSVHIDENDAEIKPWSEAGIIICRKTISDIRQKLMDVSISAPFRVVEYTQNFQILTWTTKNIENVRRVIELVKKLDP
jgi:hypothetical protein